MRPSRYQLTRTWPIGSEIKRWRSGAGLSQAELAVRLDTTQSVVSRWENGHDEPRLGTLAAILSACGLSAELVVDTGVDRAQIRQQLALTPRQRLEGVANLSRFTSLARPGSS
jgi:transcriptional regulator with XRE-family HTH domain